MREKNADDVKFYVNKQLEIARHEKTYNYRVSVSHIKCLNLILILNNMLDE